MTSPYFHSPARTRRRSTWRRWLLALIGIAVLFLAPALAHSDDFGDTVMLTWTAPGGDAPAR